MGWLRSGNRWEISERDRLIESLRMIVRPHPDGVPVTAALVAIADALSFLLERQS